MTALDETYSQEYITDEACDDLPVLVRLFEVEPIDCVRIIEGEPGKFKRHGVVTLVLLCLPIIPFEFSIAHSILVCRTRSKTQACRSGGIAGENGPSIQQTVLPRQILERSLRPRAEMLDHFGGGERAEAAASAVVGAAGEA